VSAALLRRVNEAINSECWMAAAAACSVVAGTSHKRPGRPNMCSCFISCSKRGQMSRVALYSHAQALLALVVEHTLGAGSGCPLQVGNRELKWKESRQTYQNGV
jgi:hypothetical protein